MSIDFQKKFSYTQIIMKKIFGKRLKEIRKENDEFQKDLAEIVNVDVSMVSIWEKGINYPKVEKLIEIAEHYNVSIDYLLGRVKEKTTTINTKYYKCKF